MNVQDYSGDERLRPCERLRGRSSFARVFAGRCRSADDFLAVHVAENGLAWSRLGISVSKRIGNAVSRNYAKRRVREAYRRNKTRLPVGVDHVCVVRRDLRSCDVEGSLLTMCARAARALRRRRNVNEAQEKAPRPNE